MNITEQIKQMWAYLTVLIKDIISSQNFATACIIITVILLNRLAIDNGYPGFVESSIWVMESVKGLFR
jgi:hypothetical protein